MTYAHTRFDFSIQKMTHVPKISKYLYVGNGFVASHGASTSSPKLSLPLEVLI